MPKPLRSEDPTPKSVQFSHFGVLNDGSQNSGAFATSVITNVAIAALFIIVGSIVKTKVSDPINKKEITLVKVDEKPPLPKPPPPKIPPPPKLPTPPKIEPPKIKMPEPVIKPEMKPIPVPVPKPVVAAPAPLKVNPPPAPVKVNLANPTAASVPNHDAHPSAVRLGAADNPLKPLTGPAVSRVNMGVAGMAGMPAGNTGNGPASAKVNLGSGSPMGTDLNGRTGGVRPVKGLTNGVPGGTGNSPNRGPVQVQLQTQQAQPTNLGRPAVQAPVAKSSPTVTYKPTPIYTAEAKAMHLEGNVSIRIRVTASGAVQVLGVVRGLGHGLDESAIQATQGTRFKPALDASGHPVDWEGVVTVNFQLS